MSTWILFWKENRKYTRFFPKRTHGRVLGIRWVNVSKSDVFCTSEVEENEHGWSMPSQSTWAARPTHTVSSGWGTTEDSSVLFCLRNVGHAKCSNTPWAYNYNSAMQVFFLRWVSNVGPNCWKGTQMLARIIINKKTNCSRHSFSFLSSGFGRSVTFSVRKGSNFSGSKPYL